MIKVKQQKDKMDKSQNGNSQAKSRNKPKLMWVKQKKLSKAEM